MDILPPYAAAVIRGLDVDGLHQFPQDIGRQFFQFRVLAYPLDKLLQIFCLSFLSFTSVSTRIFRLVSFAKNDIAGKFLWLQRIGKALKRFGSYYMDKAEVKEVLFYLSSRCFV